MGPASAIQAAVRERAFIFREAPFQQCHASSIVDTPEGLVATWFGGSREKSEDVEIWTSRETQGKWTKPVAVASGLQDDHSRYPAWNPVLFQVPDGPLLLFYKVGADPSEWWGLLKTSDDHGRTWSEGRRLPEGILGPSKNKPVLSKDGRLISPSSTEEDGWKVHLEMSSDRGKTWTRIDPINGAEEFGAIQPAILKHEKGTLQMLARSRMGRVVSSWSYDGGYTWSEMGPTELPNPNAGIDAVTLASGAHVLVYNHSASEPGAWGRPRTPLDVAVSSDGRDWKRVLTLEDEAGGLTYVEYESLIRSGSEPIEFSYPAVIQSKDGLVHITYTWKRRRIMHVALEPEYLA